MANKRIIEQAASTTILNDDWFVKDSPTGGTTKILTSLLRTLLGGDNFASTYDSSLTYYTGNMCIYNGILYECKAFSGTTGTFDSSKWTQLTITDYASKLLASDWRATSSYIRDDLVSYRGNIYRCASDSATVGTFVHTEWITANWDSIKIVLLRNNIAKEYDDSEIYNKGDLVFEAPYYLCVCKENGVTGAFDTSKWITDGTISDALELVDEQIIENIAGEYDSTVEYSKDALCFKDGVLYIANADTTGTWDSTKWNATTIADIIANLRIDANDVVDVTIKGDSLVNSNKIAVLDSLTAQGSASGSIASFSDGSTYPMSKLEVAIDPIQDLHGYDHPWSGGAGKNKLENNTDTQTVNGITWTLQSDGTVVANGTATATSQYRISFSGLSGNFYFNGCPSGGGRKTYDVYAWDDTTNTRYFKWDGVTASTSDYGPYGSQEINIPEGHDGRIMCRIYEGVTVNNLVFKPMIRLATETDPTFEPYSNICPISGWDEANVTRCGANVWDEEWELGAIGYANGKNVATTDRIRSKNYISIFPSTKYYYIFPNGGAYFFYDKNKTFISAAQTTSSKEVTSPPNAYFTRIAEYPEYGTVYNNDISINYPSTDTSYHAYNGQTYNIQFKDGSNPLTVYGGTLDVVSGELVVTYAKKALADISKRKYGNYQYGIRTITDFFDSIPNSRMLTGMSNTFVLSNSGESYNVDRCTIMFASGLTKTSFLISTQASGLSADASVTEINEWLRSIDAYMVYPLATPQTYQLTPTEVRSLVGNNNIWTDTGDVNEAVYTRDLNTTINDIISRIEALENA